MNSCFYFIFLQFIFTPAVCLLPQSLPSGIGIVESLSLRVCDQTFPLLRGRIWACGLHSTMHLYGA